MFTRDLKTTKSRSKSLLFSSVELPLNAEKHATPIRCLCVERHSTSATSTKIIFATAADDKSLFLWHLDVAARKAVIVEKGTFKKRPTACFFGDERSIVFGDKFGDGGVMHIGSLHNDVAREFEFGTLSSLISLVIVGWHCVR
jgi:hypothetical protein